MRSAPGRHFSCCLHPGFTSSLHISGKAIESLKASGVWPSSKDKNKAVNGIQGFPEKFKAVPQQVYNYMGNVSDIDWERNHDNATGQTLRNSIEFWGGSDIPALDCGIDPGCGRTV